MLEGRNQPAAKSEAKLAESNVGHVTVEIQAVKIEEMNPVELAYFKRIGLPHYRIYPDQEVNGSAKAQN